MGGGGRPMWEPEERAERAASPWRVGRRLRHLERYRQIAQVLARHGLGTLVETVGLSGLLPRRRSMTRAWQEGLEPLAARHVRAALEELGPTFIKLGQVLSTRADLLPPPFLVELSRLQDHVAPGPFTEVRAVLEQELGAPLDRHFARIEPEPLAAASLSPVHGATLADGRLVVVKVLRPSAPGVVRADLEILEDLAYLVRDRMDMGLGVDPVAFVHEFARSMRQELEFATEAQHIRQFARHFAREPRIHVPQVEEALTTSRVLTMERLFGVKVNDLEGLARIGADPAAVARLGAELFMTMVMVHGFFHGDPHPGNLLVEPGGRLGVLDFGLVGVLAPETAHQLVGTFLAVVRKDAAGAVRSIRRMGIVPAGVDRDRLRRDLQVLIDRHYGRPLREIALGQVVQDSLEVIYRYRLTLPPDLLILARALLVLDGLARQLDPSFNALEAMTPFARRLMRRQLSPRRQWARVAGELQEVLEIARTLPQRIDRLVDRAGAGQLTVGFRWLQAEIYARRMERAANRLALALVGAGFSIAAGLFALARAGPHMGGLPLLAWVAVLGAVVVGMLLAFGIWRSGRI